MTRSPDRRLTGIITTLNEEGNIADCLASLAFADEILVVDSFSTDATAAIAGAFPRTRVARSARRPAGCCCTSKRCESPSSRSTGFTL